MVLAPGVLSTMMPASVCRVDVDASTPTPARATTVSFGPAASSSRRLLFRTARSSRRLGERVLELGPRPANLGIDVDAVLAQNR